VVLLGVLSALASGFGAELPAGFPSIEYSIDGGSFQSAANGIGVPADAKQIGMKLGDLSPTSRDPLRNPKAMRFQYQWSGVDPGWRLRIGDMGLVVRFHNEAGNLIGQREFYARKESPGWDGTLEHSRPLRRREFVTVPKDVKWVSLLLTSAGPPDAIGTYVAGNINIYGYTSQGDLSRIFSSDSPSSSQETSQEEPEGWVRDGTNTSMARTARLDNLGRDTLAFCIVDNDPVAHAEWRLKPEAYVAVHPDEKLMIEWDEMFSIGLSDLTIVYYKCPPPGNYQFRLAVADAMGTLGAERSVPVTVFRPYWMQFWFWGGLALVLAVPSGLGIRAIIRSRVRRQLQLMEQQHLVERERLRIARNIHDDLGARLTHICLVGGRAEAEALSMEELRMGFHKVIDMTSDLVGSLYETVWSVNPENDHLDALLNHLTQMTQNMCEPASIACRIHVPEVPENHPIPSGIRHTISLTVKEALHNAIKHSEATEISARFTVDAPVLRIDIADNGQGFPVSGAERGHGLKNMHDRMEEIGGTARIESSPGKGTTIILEARILQNTP